jgi:putative colanic acid biosynthesis acetyltransferase WcaF
MFLLGLLLQEIPQKYLKKELFQMNDFLINDRKMPINKKILGRVWNIIWIFLYRPSPWFMYRFRVALLNLFGANIHFLAKPESGAKVDFPWNLTMGPRSSIGDQSWIYCLDKIVIHEGSCIGQYCKLITGSHNYRSPNFSLITAPITIEENCWLTSDVTVTMGVTIGKDTVVGVKSLVNKDILPNQVACGIPVVSINTRY